MSRYPSWQKNLCCSKSLVAAYRTVLLLCLTGLLCCQRFEEVSELELEPSTPHLAFALMQATVTSEELVDELRQDVEVTINDEGIYTLHFAADPFRQSKQDVFPKVTFGFPIPILDSIVSVPVDVFEGVILDSAVLKGDQLFFILNSDVPEDVSVRLFIPELQKDGVPFDFDYTIPYLGSLPATLQTPAISLAGYEVDFTRGSLTLQYQARRSDGTAVLLPLSFASVRELDFAYIEGGIGVTTINTGVDSIDVEIQDTVIQGTFRFQDPKIHFDLLNSFGIPGGVIIRNLVFVNKGGKVTQIESPFLDQLIPLAYPSLQDAGQVAKTRVTFDQTNSNVSEVAQDDIVQIRYNLDLLINPDDDVDDIYFVTDTSFAEAQASVELSFNAIVESIQVEQSVEVALSDLSEISSLRLKLLADNGIPLSFRPNLNFRDGETGTELILDAESQAVIEAAEITADGQVQAQRQSALFFTADASELALLQQMDTLQAILHMQSPAQGSQPAILKPGQPLDLKIGAEARLR